MSKIDTRSAVVGAVAIVCVALVAILASWGISQYRRGADTDELLRTLNAPVAGIVFTDIEGKQRPAKMIELIVGLANERAEMVRVEQQKAAAAASAKPQQAPAPEGK